MGALHSRGVSLAEILVVLAILAMAAVLAIPSLYPTDPHALDLAAQQVAEAMRYARNEAMRTGQPYGFRQNSSSERIRVFRVDSTISPWGPVYDVYHPLDKRPYDIVLSSHPFARVDGVAHNRVFRGSCNTPRNVYFDASGTPWCLDPETVLLQQFDVTLTLDAASRMVTLDGITGRVTVQ